MAAKITKKKMDSQALISMEYSSLRSEVLKRMEMQQQLITFAMVAAGTFITVSVGIDGGAILLLVYPIFVAFLAIGWYQHNTRIKRINEYIRDQIESLVPNGGWEQHRTALTSKVKRSATIMFARGAFVGTQLLTIVLAFSKIGFSDTENILLLADGVSIIAALFFVRRQSGM